MCYEEETLKKKQGENKVKNTVTIKNLSAFLGYKSISSITRADLTSNNGFIEIDDKLLILANKRAKRKDAKEQLLFLASYKTQDALLCDRIALLREFVRKYGHFVDPPKVEKQQDPIPNTKPIEQVQKEKTPQLLEDVVAENELLHKATIEMIEEVNVLKKRIHTVQQLHDKADILYKENIAKMEAKNKQLEKDLVAAKRENFLLTSKLEKQAGIKPVDITTQALSNKRTIPKNNPTKPPRGNPYHVTKMNSDTMYKFQINNKINNKV